MAVAASSSTVSFQRHDVFLNFRGDDVRNSFISFLFEALSGKKIETFKDDAKLETGNEIPPSLLKAIEESKLSIVVFSKNYATSWWCLEELLHILKCKRETGHSVIPVFFEVDPSHVMNQEGSYGDAFVELAKRFTSDKLSKWKNALTTVSNLFGFNSKAIRCVNALSFLGIY